MAEFTRYQKKLIERYYDQRESIMLARLQELVSELYVADTDKQRDRLWGRVEKAMKQLGVKDTIARHILEKRDPKVLALNIEDWLKNPPKPPQRAPAKP